MKKIIFFCCLFFPFLFCCQKHRNNSEKVFKDGVIVKLDSIDSIVQRYRYKDPDYAISKAKTLLFIPESKKTSTVQAKILVTISDAFVLVERDSAYAYLSKALAIVRNSSNLNLQAEIFRRISQFHYSVFNNNDALKYADSALMIAINTNNQKLLSNIYNDIGAIDLVLHDTINGKKNFKYSLDIGEKHLLYAQIGAATGNLASLEKDTLKSLQMLRKALQYFNNSTGNEESKAGILVNIGSYQTNNDSAANFYRLAIRQIGDNIESTTILSAYNNLVYILMDERKYREAEGMMTKALDLAIELKNQDWVATLYDTYSDLLVAMNRLDEATRAEKKAYSFRETAYDIKVTSQVRLLASLLDVKNKEMQLSISERNNQIKSQKIKQLFFFMGGLIILLLTLFAWMHQKNKVKFWRQRLDSANKIIELEERSKTRLALELHDMTSPIYTSLLRQIEDAAIPDISLKEEMVTKLQNLAEKIRHISHSMFATHADQLEMKKIITGICEEMQYRTESQIYLTLDNDFNVLLKYESKVHVIRIIQEILNNAVKYVKNGNIRLKIFNDEHFLSILYWDDGPGFATQEKANHGLGILSIHQRASLLNAQADLNSALDTGTSWDIKIPIFKNQ